VGEKAVGTTPRRIIRFKANLQLTGHLESQEDEGIVSVDTGQRETSHLQRRRKKFGITTGKNAGNSSNNRHLIPPFRIMRTTTTH